MSTAAVPAAGPPRSVFTGADVCRLAGLVLPARMHRPVFDDPVWDFTDVVGLPVQMAPAHRRFDFTAVSDPRWRLVAKELVMAMLAPRHDAVAPLPRAYPPPPAAAVSRRMRPAASSVVPTPAPPPPARPADPPQAGPMRTRPPQQAARRAPARTPPPALPAPLARHRRDGDPLPQLPDHLV